MLLLVLPQNSLTIYGTLQSTTTGNEFYSQLLQSLSLPTVGKTFNLTVTLISSFQPF